MSRLNRVAVVLAVVAVVAVVVIAAPIFRDYGIVGGLLWAAVTGGALALIIWVAERSEERDP